MLQGKFVRVRDSPWKRIQECFYETLLLTESGDQSKIDVLCKTGLTPSLNSDSTNETKTPVPGRTKIVDFLCAGKDALKLNHGRGRPWKIACCSTRPDQFGRSRQTSGASSL